MPHTDVLNRIQEIAGECGGTVSVAVRNIEKAADYAINDGIVMSAASVIKLPMLVEAMRRVAEGSLTLDSLCPIPDERTRGSGVVRYLHNGVTLTLGDLLQLMMIVSDNTAANIVIDLLGPENVNSTMLGMGYANTRLRRKMMDWRAIERGLDNLCTAREIADLLVRIARGQCIHANYDQMMVDILRGQQDASKLGLFLPDGVKLGNKTGAREGIMHDCGIVSTDRFSYAICVLTKGAKSSGDASIAIGRISRLVYDFFDERAA